MQEACHQVRCLAKRALPGYRVSPFDSEGLLVATDRSTEAGAPPSQRFLQIPVTVRLSKGPPFWLRRKRARVLLCYNTRRTTSLSSGLIETGPRASS